jgi:HD-like signal output (HDOD) protein
MNKVLDNLTGLASLPQTVLKITSMLTSGRASAAEIEAIARNDEAISMTILRWANSSAYGRPGKTFSLKESVSRLGNANLLNIVLQQKTSTMFTNAGAAYGLARGMLWRNALGGALCAQSLAKQHSFENPELAFLCGLLRDIGKLAFDGYFGAAYTDRVIACFRPNKTFIEAEREAFGFDHCQLGAALAKRWNLPDRIVTCIGYHHYPAAPGTEHDTLIDIVHAADIVCLWAGIAIGCDGMQYKLAEHVRTGLNLSRSAAENLILDTWASLKQTEALMGQPVALRASA